MKPILKIFIVHLAGNNVGAIFLINIGTFLILFIFIGKQSLCL